MLRHEPLAGAARPGIGRAVVALGRVAVDNYPDATYAALRDAIAGTPGSTERVVLTGGADEAVQLCALARASAGRRGVRGRPFTPWYGNATRLAGATLVHEASPAVRLWWLVRAHNPTGAERDRRRRCASATASS